MASDIDVLNGGKGDDRLSGGDGSDIYHFARGDGRDTLVDAGGVNRIVFAEGIDDADVSVRQIDHDIELIVANEGGRIRLVGALTGSSAIETIVFANNTLWTFSELLSRSMTASDRDDRLAIPMTLNNTGFTIEGRGGNDLIRGAAGDDTLSGGSGNDRLEGGSGNDTYIFGRGDGQDTISDVSGINMLRFGVGIAASNIRVVGGAANMVLEIIGTGDRIDLGTPAMSGMGVARVVFADGTVWDEKALIALARTPTAGDDVLIADAGDDRLSGDAGDDHLIGNGGSDTFDGGPGNDRLEGGAGDDIYHFSASGGHDRISDVAGNDVLQLGADIAPTDISVAQSRDGEDMTLVVRSTGARITMEKALRSGRIETIRFVDGTAWATTDLLTRTASIGNDVLTGNDEANVMAGGLGNDRLSGGAGDDIYYFARGDGSDVIADAAASTGDRLEISGYRAGEISFHRLGSGSDDLAIRFVGTTDQIVVADGLGANGRGIEKVVLTDGTQFSVQDIRFGILASLSTAGDDIITGTDNADTLSAGKGNDLIAGGQGDDIYLYRRGDGDDRIEAVGKGRDTVRFVDYKSSEVVSALRAGPDSHDLVVSFADPEDRIVLIGVLAAENGWNGDVTIRFADDIVWDRDDMRARVLIDSDGAGNDNVYGFDGADRFAARSGDDRLIGGEGDDVYNFANGSGNDTIIETGGWDTDEVRFNDLPSSIAHVERLYRGSNAITIGFAGNTSDSLTIFNALAQDAKGIERYVFADGVTWTKASLRSLLDNRAPDAGDDGFFTVTTGTELIIHAGDILRNDFDADGDRLRIVSVDAGRSGTARLDSEGNIRYSATGGFYGATSLTYMISDGRNGFASAEIDLRVRPVATAYPDSGFSVAEDGTLAIRVERLLANDLDGDRLIIGQVGKARNGMASLTSDGNITFTPTPDIHGIAEFTYVANTPEGGRTEAKVTIAVTPVNDAPVTRDDDVAATDEGKSFTLDPAQLLTNDRDIDGDSLTIRSVQSNADVSVAIGADGRIRIAPRAYYWGNAWFDYVAVDPNGATATGRVRFSITPVNDAPQAHDDRFETTDSGGPVLEDMPIVIDWKHLLANDIEHDGETMTVTRLGNHSGGTARLLENGTVLFTPYKDFFGEAWFDYIVDDGHGGTSEARATLVYQPVNDLPKANDDSYYDKTLPMLRGKEDTVIEISVMELLKNDFDPEGFTVRFESAGNAIHGDLEVTDHGTIRFTPDADFWGEATFTYLVSDKEGAVDGATVTMWFENVGDAPPVAYRDIVYVNEGVPTLIPIATLLSNDVDIDRDPLTYLGWRRTSPLDALRWGSEAGGTLNGIIEADANGNLLFTPNHDASKSAGFVYSVTDNADGKDEGYVQIVIVPTNDDPTVVDDKDIFTPRDAPLVLRVTHLLENDYDIEQADKDGNGIIDDDLDDPKRSRPAFVSIEGVFDVDALKRGERVSQGTFEVITWAGEQFVVVRFPNGFSGKVAVEYRIADLDGATDTGFAMVEVEETYNGTLNGSRRIDHLIGTPGVDLIRAFDGDDLVLAGEGDDRIEAGSGNDRIDAGAGDDEIDGGDGADHIIGGTGVDTVSFQSSDAAVRVDLDARIGQGGYAQGDSFINVEALIGSSYGDRLAGDAAENHLSGRAGDDHLEGRGGDDQLAGGEGNDVLSGGAGADRLDGGAGNDTADYSFSKVGVSIVLADGTGVGGDAEGDRLTGIENLIGTDADDQLEGDGFSNKLSGGRGDDSLRGGAGDDVLTGGRGADRIDGGEGIDIADYTLSDEAVVIDMMDGSAGGGDAFGDTFSGIEIVVGSYHDDTIYGDKSDNRLRGGRGADRLDGRDGFDIADYSRADEGVEVDLATGRGLTGEAAGDRLSNIEMIVGSLYSDVIVGSRAEDWFQGLRGDDRLSGGAGSDTYVFGFDHGQDTIVERGSDTDVDRIDLSDIAPSNVSVVREDNALLLEFERQDGFLIDTIRVADHFLGRATGIESVAFADGTRWKREDLDALLRLGRFNAADDIVRFGFEDRVLLIDPATLLANDAQTGTIGLTFVGVDQPINGSVWMTEDGQIAFLGTQNYNGDAFFSYTVRDAYGRQSRARVEVNLSAVNDAPTAVDDPVIQVVEDQIVRIRIDSLLANDFDVDGDAVIEDLRIVKLLPLVNEAGKDIDRYRHEDYKYDATHSAGNYFPILSGDYLEFVLRPDYFGPAGFRYVLSDAHGATGTGNVELSVQPVNDAPRSQEKPYSIRLGVDTLLTVGDLLKNTYDIEVDAITFMGLHNGLDGNPGTNGTVIFDANAGVITFTPSTLGVASLDYDVIDARGAAATLKYLFEVRPLNDAPEANNDYGFRTFEDQILIIDPTVLLANDTDENGDRLTIDHLARFADGGKVRLRDDGMIEFRPTADYNGAASFEYTISDGRGGTDSARVAITVIPRNDAPVLRNDLVSGIEDTPLIVIPGEVFGNDSDGDGDFIFFKRATVLGRVKHRFLSDGYTVDARMADGSALPSWLHFDTGTMRFEGRPPTETETASVDVWVEDPANGNIFNSRFTLDAMSLKDGFSAYEPVLEDYRIRSPFAVDFQFGIGDIDAKTSVIARLADGSPLPSWLAFNDTNLRFTGMVPKGMEAHLQVTLVFSRPSENGGSPLLFEDTIELNPLALPTGITYDSDFALFDIKNGTVAAMLAGGRPLPDWLLFDPATRKISLSGFAPDANAPPARVQIVFTPGPRVLPEKFFASSDRGFTLEFVLDPAGDVAALTAAISTVLEGHPYFAAQGLFSLNLAGAGAMSVARESGAPLPSWLHFDAETLSFTGSPPPAWVGALPLRIDIASGGARPEMSIITEAVIDDIFQIEEFDAQSRLSKTHTSTMGGMDRIDLNIEKDFHGSLVIRYDATDEKGAVSSKPALVFYNIKPARERPDTNLDIIAAREGQSVRFAVTDLLANDFDRDGDPLRIVDLVQPSNGTFVIERQHIEIAPPPALSSLPGARWEATISDGERLPDWLSIDTETGVLSGKVPVDFAGDLVFTVTRRVGLDIRTAKLMHHFDGNSGAYAIYTPNGSFSGDDVFQYIVTDDREGRSSGSSIMRVAPLLDPPTAVEDNLKTFEDTRMEIAPQLILANDFDVDGDPIRFLGVSNATNGTVIFDGTKIVFTPKHNFEGTASFNYLITDDRHGESLGNVKVSVVSTNRAPTLAHNLYSVVEDTPFEFTTLQLLEDDSDPDGDILDFQSLSRTSTGGRILELPNGRWQFVPDENVYGDIGFRYSVSDGRRVSVASVTFRIAPVNDGPIANADGAGTANDPPGVFRTKENQTVSIDFATLVHNDRDVEGDSFEIVEIFDADQGAVVRDGTKAVFTPNAGYIGDAGFHYRVTDRLGASSVGYAAIIVAPDVPLPIAVSDTGFEVLEDGFIDIDPADLMANDVAPEGTTLSFVGLAGSERLANGNYRVTPQPDMNGELRLWYSVKNEQDFAVSATVTIQVIPVADAPVANSDNLEMVEDTPLELFTSVLLTNDSDADKQAFDLTRIVASEGVAVTDLGFGQLRIAPEPDFHGAGWFDYEIEDSTGQTSTARVKISVSPVNDAPILTLPAVFKGTEDRPFYATLPADFVKDADGDALVVEVRGRNGMVLPEWLSFNPQTRVLSGQPPTSFNGTVELEIAASDTIGTTVHSVRVSIAPVNDAPVVVQTLVPRVAGEGEPFSIVLPVGMFADVDGDNLVISVTLADGSPLPVWMSFDGFRLTGVPPIGAAGPIDLLVTAHDGALGISSPFTLNVSLVNDAPRLIKQLSNHTVTEDQAVNFALDTTAFDDADGDVLTYSVRLANGASLPDWLVFNGDRFVGQPPAHFHGTLLIEVSASDGSLSVSDSFQLTISAENDAPFLSATLPDVVFLEDTAVSFTLPIGSFIDSDNDALILTAHLSNGNALPDWLTFDGYRFAGHPPSNFNGTVDIKVRATDGVLAATGSFGLHITPVNDAPQLMIALPDRDAQANVPISIDVAKDSFVDADGDTLSYWVKLADGKPLPAWLTFDGNRFIGTPPAEYAGKLNILVSASDSRLSAADTFALTVAPVAGAPILDKPLRDIFSQEDRFVSFFVPLDSFRKPNGGWLRYSAMLADGRPLPTWLRFDGNQFRGQPPTDFHGDLDIRVTAFDGVSRASDDFRLKIMPVNDAPVIIGRLNNVLSPEDTSVSFSLPAEKITDIDGDLLTLSATLINDAPLPSWLKFNGNGFIGTPPANFTGTFYIKVTASDGKSTTSDVMRLTITPINDAPILVGPLNDVIVLEDSFISFGIPPQGFRDVEGTRLSYSATQVDGRPLPYWLRFNNRWFDGVPPADFTGAIDIRVIASDGVSTTSDDFRLSIQPVNDAPSVVARIPDIASPEDMLLSFTIPAGSFTDVDGDTLTISASLANGDTLPSWMQFNGTQFSGLPPANFNGALYLKVWASDGVFTASDFMKVTITPVNDAPELITPLHDLTSKHGDYILSGVPLASFRDPEETSLSYSAALSDVRPSPTRLSFSDGLTRQPKADFISDINIRLNASDGAFTTSNEFSPINHDIQQAPVITPSAERDVDPTIPAVPTSRAMDVEKAFRSEHIIPLILQDLAAFGGNRGDGTARNHENSVKIIDYFA
ncbi:tandem-95 repeat protein [Rhizobium sp. CFBP 8762]|uniref:tandem-95 repeat protein n=1 Tax=Rhizobium sp. CFBP 8762 TaxID=2775279 RepID=UPI001FD27640|nr:tandem-95 repeat protein [Rhizobium sp. CFBP 8762]